MAGGTLTEKKRYQMRCNLLLLTAVAVYVGGVAATPYLHIAQTSIFHSIWGWWLLASAPWLWGLAEYAKSKGQSPFYGVLGIFSLIGLIILACLPDRFILEPDKVKMTPSVAYGVNSRERW